MYTNIPVISMKDYTSAHPQIRRAFIQKVGEGLEKFGFISIVDHQISDQDIGKAYLAAREFFALPTPIKLRYEIPDLAGQRGYTSFQKEHAKSATIGDLKEFWHIGPLDCDFVKANIWPQEVPNFYDAFKNFYTSLQHCSKVLLEACALYLGEAPQLFADMVTKGDSILRVIHYPPVPEETHGAIRAAAHEDINFITLLCGATQPGLELLSRDNTWVPIPSIPGQIIVDTGDMLQNLTNGIFKSTTHRVVNPLGENISRYSMPFFVHPRSSVSLAPLPSCVKKRGSRPEYRNFAAGDYLKERLGEIGLIGKKSQIDQSMV